MTNELLPFNLEEALKNPERVVYRNGEKPLEWHWLKSADQNGDCIVNIDSTLDINTNRINGSFDKLLGSRYDLMLLPLPEKRYWVNVFSDNGRVWCTNSPHLSEESAILASNSPTTKHYYLKTISFTI